MTTKDEALKLALEALEYEAEKGNDDAYRVEREAIKEALAQPEFIKHEVENAEDWSEWVCPDPQGYLMKCCDCGLVHEAQFKVVQYKSEDEREECDPVNDPNVQAVFRMRRSEQWSPKDTAYRPGGLAQPEHEPVKMNDGRITLYHDGSIGIGTAPVPTSNTSQERVDKTEKQRHEREPVIDKSAAVRIATALGWEPKRKPLTDEELRAIENKINPNMRWRSSDEEGITLYPIEYYELVRAIEAAHGIFEDKK